MTTGSYTEDNRALIPVLLDGNPYFGQEVYIGTRERKVWNGDDSPKRTDKTVYEKQFYRVPVTVPGKPGKWIVVKRWKTRIVKSYLPEHYTRIINQTVRGKQHYGYVPATRWKEFKTVSRYPVWVRKWLPPTKPRVKQMLRYRIVANPKPPRTFSEEHSYDMSFSTWHDAEVTMTRRINPRPSELTETYTVRASSAYFFGNPASSPDTWESNDDLMLLGKLREKVAGSDFNFAVFLAEGSESLKLLANSATRLTNAYSAMSKGNLGKAWRALANGPIPKRVSAQKSTSQNWLEMQYGWKPLLKDAEAGAQFLAHLSLGGCRQTVRTTKRKPLREYYSLDPDAGRMAIGWDASMAKTIKATFTDVSTVALSGLGDPASVIWEKLPYSFVADWFIPIGSFLSARGLAASVKGTFVTTFVTRIKNGGVVPKSGLDDPYETRYSSSNFTYRKISVLRTISSGLSVPTPNVKPLSEALSWQHTANAVALLISRFGSRREPTSQFVPSSGFRRNPLRETSRSDWRTIHRP